MKRFFVVIPLFLLCCKMLKAQTATEVLAQDTRDSATTPSSYSRSFQVHFKTNSSVQLPAAGTGFSTLIGVRGWINDNSGGKVHELAFSDDDQIYVRSGFSPSWDGWRKFISESSNGNVGIGNVYPAYKLQVQGDAEIGDSHDGNKYGILQLIRPANQDSKFHLAFIRNGNSVSGMGYAPNSNVLGIWHVNNNTGTPLMSFNYLQRVGIGTLDPNVKFQINTSDFVDGMEIRHSNNGFIRLSATSWGQGSYNPVSQTGDAGLVFGSGSLPINCGFVLAPWSNSVGGLRIDKDGNVGIATGDTKGYRFAVNGDAIFTKIKVKTYGTWPDYVFNKTYRLPSLKEVEEYIQAHCHLPGIPSAKEVEENGLDVGANEAALLKKIEELTLYLIEIKKQVADQQKEIIQLKQTLNNSIK